MRYRFFRPEQECQVPSFIDLGGNAFCALTVWLMEHVGKEMHPSPMDENILQVLFERHFHAFPEHRSVIHGVALPTQWLKRFMAWGQRVEFILQFQHTLGCIALEQLCTEPERYPLLFLGRDAENTMNTLLALSAWPEQMCFAALVKFLGLPTKLYKIDSGRDLPAVTSYAMKNDSIRFKPTFILQLIANDDFRPWLAYQDWYKALHLSFVPNPLAPKVISLGRLLEIREQLLPQMDDILLCFDEMYHRLANLMQLGELNRQDLILIYTNLQQELHKDQKNAVPVGIEHGTQYYFSKLSALKHHQQRVRFSAMGYQEQISEQLMCAISRILSLNQWPWSLIEKYAEDSSVSLKM